MRVDDGFRVEVPNDLRPGFLRNTLSRDENKLGYVSSKSSQLLETRARRSCDEDASRRSRTCLEREELAGCENTDKDKSRGDGM